MFEHYDMGVVLYPPFDGMYIKVFLDLYPYKGNKPRDFDAEGRRVRMERIPIYKKNLLENFPHGAFTPVPEDILSCLQDVFDGAGNVHYINFFHHDDGNEVWRMYRSLFENK